MRRVVMSRATGLGGRDQASAAAAPGRLKRERDMTTPDDEEQSAGAREVLRQRSKGLECQIRKQQFRTAIGGAVIRNSEGARAGGAASAIRVGSMQ